ncbi:amino acid permease [Pseudolysinimonas sp.]|uniref:amino acid permease n=1 Tax=Pseudolysinimonas sp. TaxID=2680009 RepID=UPI003F7D2CF9
MSTHRTRPAAHQLRLPAATALVVGSVIGIGVFGIPAGLAGFGPISLVAFVLVTVGALALALVFGALSRRAGDASGGPYVYAREAFGEFAGFLNAWTYWVTAWAGNAAIVVALVGYVEVFVNTDHNRWWSLVIALVGLWIPVLVNALGLRSMGAAQTVFTVLKIIPLAFIALVGVFFIRPENFGAFNSSGSDGWTALAGAGALALFAYLGIETASVAAKRVRDPERNVPRATVIGTLISAIVYILGTLAVFGLVSNAALRTSTAPFSDAANAMLGGTWAGQVIAVFAIVSGLGCLIGWTLIIGEMPFAAAQHDLFPRVFLTERRNVPIVGVVVSTVLASLLTVLAYTSFDQVFVLVALLTVFTSVVPYMFSAGAQILDLVRGRGVRGARFARDLTIAIIALAFTFWALLGSGQEAVFAGTACVLLAIPLYAMTRAARRRANDLLPEPTAEAASSPDARLGGPLPAPDAETEQRAATLESVR